MGLFNRVSWFQRAYSKLHYIQKPRILIRTYTSDNVETYHDFSEFLFKKKEEAERSLLVQVANRSSVYDLYNYAKANGLMPQKIFYYHVKDDLKVALIEFSSIECINDILSSSSFTDKCDCIPVTSRLLWFKPERHNHDEIDITESSVTELKLPSERDLSLLWEENADPSQSVMKLFRLMKISDIEVRLRFFICQQLKDMLKGIFPHCDVTPFGSSVNGFGSVGCDLDMFLVLNTKSENSRLIFHTKEAIANPRYQNQKYMELFADMLSRLMPGCSHVARILRARVPIIKFHHQYGGIECDLSMDSDSGVYMSEMLWLMTKLDERVAPFVFMIRQWAKHFQLTSEAPGRWITNFSLTLLALFYFQNKTEPVLPNLNQLRLSAGSEDQRVSVDGLNCSFCRTPNCIAKSTNNEPLHELLLGFFVFYGGFNWSKFGISLNTGKIVNKPDFSPMYIENPLDPKLNVSQNVSLEEVDRFTDEITSAVWRIECVKSDNNNSSWTLKNLMSDHKPVDGYSFGSTKMKLDNLLNRSTENKLKLSKNLIHNDAVSEYIDNLRNKKKKKLKRPKSDYH